MLEGTWSGISFVSRDWLLYVDDPIDSAEKIQRFLSGRSFESFPPARRRKATSPDHLMVSRDPDARRFSCAAELLNSEFSSRGKSNRQLKAGA